MPTCCGGGACNCRIEVGDGLTLTGTGTLTDPFVIEAAFPLTVQDNDQFDLDLALIAGTYHLEVNYASTAKLDGIPDVNAPGPANGQVLAWNAATQTWVPQNPTTAAAGSVTHDQSLTGDGSAGAPLAAVLYAARGLALHAADGIGLSDAAVNQMVRGFLDGPARDLASPAPDLNTLSMLDTAPGRIDYWNGSQWLPLPDSFDTVIVGGEFMALSGSFLGSRVTHLMKQFSGTTDPAGVMDILTPADLAGFAGVLRVTFQETGTLSFKAVVFANTDRVSAYVYRIADGVLYPAQAFTGQVDAWLY